MKKRILLILCLVCMLVLASGIFVACNGGGDDTCTAHVDANNDGKCDNCGIAVNNGGQPCTDHVDVNMDGKCDNCGGAMGSDSEKTVSAIEIAALPAKTEYVIGDAFSIAGGTIKVIYGDGSSTVIPMSSGGVTVSSPVMTTASSKTITVRYGEQRVTFKINVAAAQYVVTFDLNYTAAPEAETEIVGGGSKAASPDAPTRTGYTFITWYTRYLWE